MATFTLGEWMKQNAPSNMGEEKNNEVLQAGSSEELEMDIQVEAARAGGSSADAGMKEMEEEAGMNMTGEALDAAAMQDGLTFDLNEHWKTQTTKAEGEGEDAAARSRYTRTMLYAKKLLREKADEAEIMAVFRSLRTVDIWAEKDPREVVEGYFKKHPGRDDKLRAALTPERLERIRTLIPGRNPAQVGFVEDLDKLVTIRLDDMRGVRSPKEVATLLTAAGFSFRSDKAPEDYIIFIDGDNTDLVKITAQVEQSQRAVDLISGEKPFLLDNFPVSARVYSTQNLRKGKVLKLEGAICGWVKKMHLLGVPLSRIMWQIVECLMALGLAPRSAYLDDEGAAKRMVNVNSDDFGVLVEFFSEEDARLAVQHFDLTLADTKPVIYEGDSKRDALFTTPFTLKPFQIRKLQETHPNSVLLKTGAGFGQQLRILVEERTGVSTKAAVAWYVEEFFRTEAPHLEIGLVEPETYPQGNVNFNLGVRIYYKGGDEMKKAMLAVYASFATRSEGSGARRLDYTRKEGEPYNDMRCEVYFSGRRIASYKECGMKDDANKQADLDKRGWANDPINYFETMWGKNWSTSKYESQVLRQEKLRQAGLNVPLPPIGSTENRADLTPGSALSEQEKHCKRLSDKEGEALLQCPPVFPLFWQHANPHTEPVERGVLQPNPMVDASKWNEVLRKVSPELLLFAEWEQVVSDSTEALEKEYLAILRSQPLKGWWFPAPAYNGIPINPDTVQAPQGECKDMDGRKIFAVGRWGTDAARIFKALSALIATGNVVQVRRESGLYLSAGPRIRDGIVTEGCKPSAYHTGSGYDLLDEDAKIFALLFVEVVKTRGLLWVAAGLYDGKSLPPYLVGPGALKEDVWTTHLRTQLELEDSHFTQIMQYILSTSGFTQIVSPATGGIYILSQREQLRRTREGLSNDLYKPVPWEFRNERIVKLSSAGSSPGPEGAGGVGSDRPTGTEGPLGTVPEGGEGSDLDDADVAALLEADRPKAGVETTQLEDGFVFVHYEWTRSKIAKLAEDEDCPKVLGDKLRLLSDGLPAPVATEPMIRMIATKPELEGTLTKSLASIALHEKVKAETGQKVAQMASDLYRLDLVHEHVAVLKAETPEALVARLEDILAYPALREGVLNTITDIVNDAKEGEETRAMLSPLLKDEAFLLLVEVEKKARLGTTGGKAVGSAASLMEITDTTGADREERPEVESTVGGIDSAAAAAEKAVTGTLGSDNLHLHYHWTREKLLELATNSLCPGEMKVKLGAVSEELPEAVASVMQIRILQIDVSLQGTLLQAVANLAFDEEADVKTGTVIAQLAQDLHRAEMVRMRLGLLREEMPEPLRSQMDEISRYPGLLEFSQDRMRVISADLEQPESIRQRMATLSESVAFNNAVNAEKARGKSALEARAMPEQTGQRGEQLDNADRKDIAEGGTPPLMSRALDTETVGGLHAQLTEICGMEGMTEAAMASIVTLGKEVETRVPLDQMIAEIRNDVAHANKIHSIVAQASVTGELDMTVRIELAQIAVELYLFWRLVEGMVAATFDPQLPAQCRVLVVRLGSNPALFTSICRRLEIMADLPALTAEQKVVMTALSTHALLKERTGYASAQPAGGAMTLDGSSEAESSEQEGGKKTDTKMRKDNKDKTRDTAVPLAKGAVNKRTPRSSTPSKKP